MLSIVNSTMNFLKAQCQWDIPAAKTACTYFEIENGDGFGTIGPYFEATIDIEYTGFFQ